MTRVWLPGIDVAATLGGCPGEFDTTRRLCSWSFSIPGTDSLEVSAQLANGQELSATLDVHPNDCARNIAYLEASETDGSWSFAEPAYINPCSTSGL